jgi:hypothetical protein
LTERPLSDPDSPAGSLLVELFNLARDPSEKTNLAAAEPERVRELRARLADYARQAVAPKAAPKAKDFRAPKVWGEKD